MRQAVQLGLNAAGQDRADFVHGDRADLRAHPQHPADDRLRAAGVSFPFL